MDNVYVEIREDKARLVTMSYQDLNLESLVTDAFAQNVMRRSAITHRALFGMGAAQVAIGGGGEEYWSIMLPKMQFNCPFASEGGVAWPRFVKNPGTDILWVPWTPPDDMRLVFGVQIVANAAGVHAGKCWLIAYDPRGAAFRLPIGNVFEDCAVCMGDYRVRWHDSMSCLDASVTQFMKAPSNSDLLDSVRSAQIKGLFSYTPKDEGFIQNPPAKAWPSYCEKVGGAAMDTYFQPVKL